MSNVRLGMRAIFLLPMAMLVLSSMAGCDRCYVAESLNIRAVSPPDGFEIQDSQPTAVHLLAPDLIDALLIECEPRVGQRFICLLLRVKPGAKATLSGTTLELRPRGGQSVSLEIPLQSYAVACIAGASGAPDCHGQIEETSHVKRSQAFQSSSGSGAGRVERWEYKVAPPTEFIGRSSSGDPLAWRLFSKYSGWYEYQLQLVPSETFRSQSARVQLPDLYLDGKRYKFPVLEVQFAARAGLLSRRMSLTPPSSGRLTAGCAIGKPPLMSNVR
jgi:hypothetical protein